MLKSLGIVRKVDSLGRIVIPKELRTTMNIVEDETNRKTSKKGNVRPADTWGVVREGDMYKGSNLMGRLLMELRDNGKLEYHLPEDIFGFISILKSSGQI